MFDCLFVFPQMTGIKSSLEAHQDSLVIEKL